MLQKALAEDRQIFVFGNGGSAANASHFVTDLGKGSSDKVGKRFRCLSLNDNVSWMTALGNDYCYEDVFVRQLQNFGRRGDVAFVMSVSGNSPNLVRAIEWSAKNGLSTIALVGKKRGRLAEIAEHVIVIDSRTLRPSRRRAHGHLPHALLRLHGKAGIGQGWGIAVSHEPIDRIPEGLPRRCLGRPNSRMALAGLKNILYFAMRTPARGAFGGRR